MKTASVDIDRIFDYEVPFNLLDTLELGMRVATPFGSKNTHKEGYVVGFINEASVSEDRIKMIAQVLDKYPVFSKETISLGWWMKEKYYTTLTQCLQTIMPTGIGLNDEVKLLGLNLFGQAMEEEKNKLRLTEKNIGQLFVIEFLENFGATTSAEIKKSLKLSDSPIKTLLKKGVIKEVVQQQRRNMYGVENIKKTNALKLTDEQQKAMEAIEFPGAKPVLIHGVTGSGKTEIYLQAIEKVIAMGKEAIVLVPEISLTPQLSERFFSRFGNKVAVSHSKMSAAERLDVWQRAKNKEISVMIGARSAVFTPFENLGIIIIDEEHEGTYKSENTPKYDAREVAEFRCGAHNAKVVYGTATPSLQTYTRALKNEINLVKLTARPFKRNMPVVQIVDMRNELCEGNRSMFSRELYEGIAENLKNKRQTILFINRRGFSTFISCRQCGHVMKCQRCDVSYTYHSAENRLRCHYCGKTETVPKICPVCGSKYIKYFGVGTQKVEDEAKKYFPEARILRMDMDTTAKKNSHKNILQAFERGEADILIGTQMIAKGHDFPNVTLVGAIAADLSLNTGDFRGGETTFQLITQVCGRAGRDNLIGKAIIQTYQPDNYIIQLAAKGDYEEFYSKEAMMRETMGYPPFSNLFSVMAFGKKEEDVIAEIERFGVILRNNNRNDKFMVLGPSPAIISKIKDEYRWKIFIKGDNEEALRKFVVACTEKHRSESRKKSVLINIALNPYNLV